FGYAAQIYRTAANSEPTGSRAAFYAGLAAEAADQPRLSAAMLEEAVRQAPDDPDILAASGRALAGIGDVPGAMRRYEAALGSAPCIPEALAYVSGHADAGLQARRLTVDQSLTCARQMTHTYEAESLPSLVGVVMHVGATGAAATTVVAGRNGYITFGP